MSSINSPVHEIKLARIRATIWLNKDHSNQAWYSVAFSKNYLDEGTWKDTRSFRRDDLPLVAKAAELAYAWIWQKTAAQEKQHAGS